MKLNQKGLGLISLIFVIVIGTAIAIWGISRFGSGEDQESATELIDKAEDTVDQVEDAQRKATELIDQAQDLAP